MGSDALLLAGRLMAEILFGIVLAKATDPAQAVTFCGQQLPGIGREALLKLRQDCNNGAICQLRIRAHYFGH